MQSLSFAILKIGVIKLKTNHFSKIHIVLIALFSLFSVNVFAAPPANDNFTNAEVLSGIQVHITRSNVDATKESGEPDHALNAGGKSVWFKWTAPMTRVMSFTTNRTNSNLNTMIHIYTGSTLPTLFSSTFNNDIDGPLNLRSFSRLRVTQGSTYYIAVDGFNDGQTTAEGTFLLDIQPSFNFQGADYNSDGLTDFSVFRPSNGTWYTFDPASGNTRSILWGLNGDIPVVASFSGNGANSPGVFRPSEGLWYLTSCCQNAIFQWGINGDIPVPANYGGEEGTDIAVFRPSEGIWYIYNSQDKHSYYQFGLQGDIPVPGNYSPDSVADIAVFRPSNGIWYFIKRVNGNPGLDTFSAVQFGLEGDKPVPADYDGDGILDIAVYRPSAGTWWVLQSSDGQARSFQWGIAEDIPTTGDFDGDGLFDFAVFRPSNGNWYVHRSGDNSVQIKNFGLAGDIPVTSNSGR